MIQANTPIAIEPDLMIPDLLQRFPAARPVLDRYGLSGCGGHHGPVESLAFFARTHGVNEARLLNELRLAAAQPDQSVAAEAPSIADTIYRRFFAAGILLILTAGATWGAWLLWNIGVGRSFTGISLHHVNAHGHAQIYGWVGLFIMGFAYQAFPRIWHTKLVAPRLAVAAFLAMVGGLTLRTIGMTWPAWGLTAAMAGGALEGIAILFFTAQVLATYRRGGHRFEPYIAFIVMALVWFIAMTALDLRHTFVTMTAATREALLWQVATWQAPLRDLQIHGLALFMILGVSIRMLPALFGLPSIPDRRAWVSLAILTLSVLAEVALFVAYRFTGSHVLAAFLLLPWIGLTVGCAMIVLPWRPWRPFPEGDRSAKFIRTAYLWLGASLVMLLMLPVYQWISGIPFSHAYYGAIRHAITVGFISLMIMGFAAKVVPTLNGLDTRTLSSLWGPFILINLGCFLRVSLQTLTDWHPGFFIVIGISGTLEVIALAWWGGHLLGIMIRGRREQQVDAAPAPRLAQITPDARVTAVLDSFPATAEVFDQYGFALLRNPIARRTLARGVSLSQAARMHKVDIDQFLLDLHRAARAESPESSCAECTHTCA